MGCGWMASSSDGRSNGKEPKTTGRKLVRGDGTCCANTSCRMKKERPAAHDELHVTRARYLAKLKHVRRVVLAFPLFGPLLTVGMGI